MHKRPLLPYGRQSIDEDDIQAVVKALRSDMLTTGPEVEKFESALSTVAGVTHAVAVNSGTAALHVAYEAVGLQAGDTIITTPLTFVATASCAMHLGARVRFADVDPHTGNLDPESVDAVIDSDCRLVVPVDYAGHVADYDAIRRIAERHDCGVIGDAAHSLGALRNGRSSPQLADGAATSFHPVKLLTTAEGGAFLTQRDDWAARARRFRNHGIERDPNQQRGRGGEWYYEVQAIGLNYRLPDVLCALGTSQLRKLKTFLERRQKIASQYTKALSTIESLQLPTTEAGVEPSWHLYVVRVMEAKRREAFFQALRESGLGVQLHYHPVHLHPLFEDLGFVSGSCPVAEDFAARAVSLPIFPAMQDEDVERVIETVTECARDLL